MRILLVNPNTTVSMTEKMVAAGSAVVGAGTTLTNATAAFGPESIEGYYDEVFCVPALLEAIRADGDSGPGAGTGADAVVIGCFDDTGVDAARCIVDVPVIGLCQAAMQFASVLAASFSVVTTLGRSIPPLEDLARRYGFAERCRRVRASEVPVLDLERGDGAALGLIRAEIAAALRDDGAEAIVLGCAGMADLARDLSVEFAVPVVEGVTAAIKTVEGLAAIGLRTSKAGGYAPPRAKRYGGGFARFAPDG